MRTRILGMSGYWYAERSLDEDDNVWERIVEPCKTKLGVKWQLFKMKRDKKNG